MSRASHVSWLTALAVLAGCGERIQPLEPTNLATPGTAAHAVVTTKTLDLSGVWDFSSENFIHLDEFSAEVIFGFTPEGKRTTLRCAAEGILTLAQTGSAITGFLQSEAICVTTGGQVAAFSDDGQIVDGTIRGRSVHFTLLGDPGAVECPGQGTVKLHDGVAVSLSGTFACIEPGHPQSTWAAPPPRFGPNRTQWQAHRPS
jgi:hypothetical protein